MALATHYFLTATGLGPKLTPLDALATVLSSLMHDFNHPGTSNAHEIRAATARATTHSVLAYLECPL
jgi:hypothetical protein